MLGPDMILEDVLYGEELESKGEFYKAYWIYMYAESATDREDEAMCLIGSPESFAEANAEASTHRMRVWKYLTEEEKERARQGENPFGDIPGLIGSPPFDLGMYYLFYVDEDILTFLKISYICRQIDSYEYPGHYFRTQERSRICG